MKVVRALNQVGERCQSGDTDPQAIRTAHRQALRDRDASTTRPPRTSRSPRGAAAGGRRAAYEDEAPLFAQHLPARGLRQDRADRQRRRAAGSAASAAGDMTAADRGGSLGARGARLRAARRRTVQRRAHPPQRRRAQQRAPGISGDAVLNLVVAELSLRRFPRAAEGDLSRLRARLVSREPLAQVAANLRLGEVARARLGGAEERRLSPPVDPRGCARGGVRGAVSRRRAWPPLRK